MVLELRAEIVSERHHISTVLTHIPRRRAQQTRILTTQVCQGSGVLPIVKGAHESTETDLYGEMRKDAELLSPEASGKKALVH